jgi:hypothetical protein
MMLAARIGPESSLFLASILFFLEGEGRAQTNVGGEVGDNQIKSKIKKLNYKSIKSLSVIISKEECQNVSMVPIC